MAKFISDDEMAQLDKQVPVQSKSSKFISDDEMTQLESSQVSPLESAGRGLAQGASMGFADELTGGVEALWEAAKGNPATFGELYKKARDESRANYDSAEKTNPKSFMAGQVGGAVGTALIPGLGGANVAKLAAQGAAQGLGSSEADLTEGDIAGAARDTAIGGTIGAVAGGTGKALGALGSKTVTGIKNVIDDVATAPMGQAGAKMGMVAKGIEKVGQVGDKFDEMTKTFTKGAVDTGSDVADRIVNQVAKKSAYLIPGVGKAIAAADVASAVPAISQKVAQTVAPTLESLIPQMGKFSKVLSDAAQRGTTSLASTDFVLQQTNPEYRQQKSKLTGQND